jgi:superfamily II DNA or RNA helicase
VLIWGRGGEVAVELSEARRWQKECLVEWKENQYRGIVSVATGGGKTIFAFIAFKSWQNENKRILIIVPTEALADQWAVNINEELGFPEDDIAILNSKSNEKNLKKANLIIINSARKLQFSTEIQKNILLVVDECHRSGSEQNSKALKGNWGATLGLSATPVRQFDDGFEKLIEPNLGKIIYEYSVSDAINDGVLTPFTLVNIQVPLSKSEEIEHEKLTKQIARLFARQKNQKNNTDDDKLEVILRKRARNYNNAVSRVPTVLKILDELHGQRVIIFHESIKSVDRITRGLINRGHSVVAYHSKIGGRLRRDNLRMFRRGIYNILVTCRALDEGLNVPETEIAIIAAATSSDRQRIQRLGRVLRPAKNKNSAIVITLFATDIEQRRLIEESSEMPDIIETKWQKVRVPNVSDL